MKTNCLRIAFFLPASPRLVHALNITLWSGIGSVQAAMDRITASGGDNPEGNVSFPCTGATGSNHL